MKTKNIELVDELTNEIMDYIREEFKLKADSDKDDRIYSFIHNTIREGLYGINTI